ncbi:hypothetical protein L596_020407 [Steinernema carpocapsae]|uniref:Globin domain-containing protein n=1 Tax=Steinernema carpocapsae TaxID=34508 RepID=A0A4U5MTG3_STECR|nr:hypothetical protein L596_020407 [Steinernema carpocapsae]
MIFSFLDSCGLRPLSWARRRPQLSSGGRGITHAFAQRRTKRRPLSRRLRCRPQTIIPFEARRVRFVAIATILESTDHHESRRMRADSNNCLVKPGTTVGLTPHSPKPLRRCRSASPAPPRAPLLTPEQQMLLRRSWQRVSKSTIGKTIVNNMILKCPETKSMFGAAADGEAIQRHYKHFVDLIQCAVDNLNDLETALQPWLDTLGKGHAGFSIRTKHWDAFGEAVASSIAEWVGPGRGHKETVKAWMRISCFLADRLSAATRNYHGNPMCTPRIQMLTLLATGPSPPY